MVEQLGYPAIFVWAAAASVLGAAVLLGLAFRSRPRRVGGVVVALSVAAIAFLWAPQVLTHRLQVIDAQRIEWTDGYWWSPSRHAIDLRSVRCIAERSEPSGRSTSRVWLAHMHDRSVRRIVHGDLLSAHSDRLMALLASHRLPPCPGQHEPDVNAESAPPPSLHMVTL